MAEPILRAGAGAALTVPLPARGSISRRQELRDRLRQALGRRLVLIQAGPGCGKTTYLASFAHEEAQSRAEPNGWAVTWLTLGRLHRDRVQLLADLVLALRTVRAELGSMTLAALSKSREAPRRWPYLLELLNRELHEADLSPTLLVLDQYERVSASASARDTIDHLVRSAPRNLTFLLSTRQPPELPSLPRLRAGGEVAELGTADLCFTADEVNELFIQHLGRPLSGEALAGLLAKTGGWPAGVRMACAMARTRGEQSLLTFSGSLPEVYDYLDEEVFQPEPPGARRFLMSAALVDPLTPELGRELADGPEGMAALARLERGDYFVSAGGPVGANSYSQHPVFRDFLLRKLAETCTPSQIQEIHRRLARIFRQSEQWDAAIHHGLEAGDYQSSSELVISLAEVTIAANNLETLARWIDAFPATERDQRGWLLFYRGVVHRVNREWETALVFYNRAADLFRSHKTRDGLARTLWYASQVLAYRRNQQQALELASEALSLLGPSESASRAWILHSMGNCYFDLGQSKEALRCHREAEGLFAAQGDLRGEMMQSHALALAFHRLGHLREAQHHYLRALGMQTRSGDVNMLCWVQAGLAHLRALRGEYADARAGLQEVVEMAQAHHLRPAEVLALSCLADVNLDQGHYDEAETCCRQALAACDEFDDDAPRVELRLKLMEMEVRRGRPEIARDSSLSVAVWFAASNLELPRIAHALLEAIICLAERRFDQAAEWAQEGRRLAEAMDARYHQAWACYLLGVAACRRGDTGRSLKLVEELLPLVDGEGYVGFLLREPEATRELLAAGLRRPAIRQPATGLLLKLSRLREQVTTTKGGTTRRGMPRATGEGDSRPLVAAAEGQIAAFFLGPIRVQRGGALISDRAWRTAKAKELFAYLLSRSDASASRDELLEVLWPDLAVDSAVSNFHFTLHSLRHALEPNLPAGSPSRFLVLSGRRYRLELPPTASVDVREFRAAVAEGSKQMRNQQVESAIVRFEQATSLYQGDYLADLYVDWAEMERQELLRSYLNVSRYLAWAAYVRRDYDQVSRCTAAVLSRDNYVEDAHRLLMRAACETGNPAQALRQYEDLVRILQTELGANPETATRKLHRRILEGIYQRPALPNTPDLDELAGGGDL